MPTPFPITIDADKIATVTIEQPGKPVVVLNIELLQRLEASLASLPRDLRGLILASNSRAFIAGADLKAMCDLSDEQLRKYIEYGARVAGMIPRLGCPSVAAINGAALGGGLELAMHCDGLVAAPPPQGKDGAPGKAYPVGLPAAGLCICPGWGGTNLLPARMDPAEAIRRTAVGRPFTFDEGRDAGLFDAVAPAAPALLDTAKAWLKGQSQRTTAQRDGAPWRWIGRSCKSEVLKGLNTVKQENPRGEPAQAVLDAVDIGLSHGWERALAREQEHLYHLRNQPAAKAAIQAFFAKSVPPPKG